MLFRLVTAAALILALATPAARALDPVPADLAALSQALEMTAVLEVMREEGLDYGEDLAEQMFAEPGDADWQATVSGIYDGARLRELFDARFALALEGADLAPMVDFFTSDIGRRVTTLEISARRAMLDPAVDEAASLASQIALAEDDPRIELIRAFIEAGDLIEANVTGGLNANLAFFRGLAAGGASTLAMSEDEMLATVWEQEETIRADTEEWLLSYLFLAYAPLTDADLAAYTEFSLTPEGLALNRALFAAFDTVFAEVSFGLGRAAALRMAGQEL